ncbi:hypothetical protein, partial [Streptomyces sp. NPDC056821]
TVISGTPLAALGFPLSRDDHTAYLSSTTDYMYDPVDRLAKAVKTGNCAGTETYVHDDNANVVNQTVQGRLGSPIHPDRTLTQLQRVLPRGRHRLDSE